MMSVKNTSMSSVYNFIVYSGEENSVLKYIASEKSDVRFLNFYLEALVLKRKEENFTSRDYTVVFSLLFNGAKLMSNCIIDKRRCTILDLALEINDERLIKPMLLFFEDFDNAVFAAVSYQSLKLLKIALEVNSNWNNQSSDFFNTPLHIAVTFPCLDITRFILTSYGGWEARNLFGETPLFFAVRHNKIEQAILLLQYGSNFRAMDNNGNNVLHTVSSQEDGIHIEILEFLLEIGCDPNLLGEDGQTPLHLVAKNQNSPSALDAAKILIKRGADVNLANGAGETPLHTLARHCEEDNFISFLSLFLESGVETNRITYSNETFLDILLKDSCFKRHKIFRYLILIDADDKFQFGTNSMSVNSFYFQFEVKCRNELYRLESKKIDEFQTQEGYSFLKILNSNVTEISKICKNPNLRAIMSELNELEFLIYGSDLKNKFQLGLKIFLEEEEAFELLDLISNGVLDYDSMLEIMKYISSQELVKLKEYLYR